MWNNYLWFIEQVWITLFKAFVIKTCTAYFDFTNLPLKYSILKRGHIFFFCWVYVCFYVAAHDLNIKRFFSIISSFYCITLHQNTSIQNTNLHSQFRLKSNFFYHQLLWKLCSNRFSSEERTASQVSHCLFLACNPLRRTT